MKKLVFLAFSFFLCYQSMAQIFVQRDKQEYLFNRDKENEKEHGGDNPDPDPGAPLGSGLLVLTGLSLGYACIKRSRKEDEGIFYNYKEGIGPPYPFLLFSQIFHGYERKYN